jgi:hypothetical protein
VGPKDDDEEEEEEDDEEEYDDENETLNRYQGLPWVHCLAALEKGGTKEA